MKKEKTSLVGFMGSGKSHMGRRLAKKLNIPFIDLDKEIVGRYNTSIVEIFDSEGEAGFRAKETTVLKSLLQEDRAMVLSTGGGAPCFHDNMSTLTEHSTVIFLNPSIEDLAHRLEYSSTIRPILEGKKGEELKAHVTDLLAKRLPYYQQAHLTVSIDNRPHGRNADYLYRMLSKYKEALR